MHQFGVGCNLFGAGTMGIFGSILMILHKITPFPVIYITRKEHYVNGRAANKVPNWSSEAFHDMTNKREISFVEYVLYGDDDSQRGQAGLFRCVQRPPVDEVLCQSPCAAEPPLDGVPDQWLETCIVDNQYPQRKISTIYSGRDLKSWTICRR